MSVILFILILGALIFVHELGHFLIAKKNGIRVDEFAIGFPPRIFSIKRGGTRYCLNSIPFGGYVKIFGENPDEESLDPNAKDSFVNKSRWVQAAVLIGGVFFNMVFAWFLFLIILNLGMPALVTDDNYENIVDPDVVITGVREDSPASNAGLEEVDIIKSINGETEVTVDLVINQIVNSEGVVDLEILRGEETLNIQVTPETGILGDVPAIGISMDLIGIRKFGFFESFVGSFKMTWQTLVGVFVGLGTLITGQVSLDQVSGPVGIVSLVDSAAVFGFANLLAFTALLSVNLAVLNILPFPALDGGRLLFLAIEGITRKRIKPAIANTINSIGFLILIGLMILITINDVGRLF